MGLAEGGQRPAATLVFFSVDPEVELRLHTELEEKRLLKEQLQALEVKPTCAVRESHPPSSTIPLHGLTVLFSGKYIEYELLKIPSRCSHFTPCCFVYLFSVF